MAIPEALRRVELLRAQQRELQSRVQQRQQQIADLDRKIPEQQAQLARLQQERAQLENQLRAAGIPEPLVREHRALQQTRDQRTAEAKGIQAEMDKVRQAIATEQRRREALAAEKARLEQQKAALR